MRSRQVLDLMMQKGASGAGGGGGGGYGGVMGRISGIGNAMRKGGVRLCYKFKSD
jgi:hypothetical protein